MGYAGGSTPKVHYRNIGDHVEAFAVDYDPRVLSYEQLLARFWSEHNPSHPPFLRQYMSAVFPLNDTQEVAARASLEALEFRHSGPIHTALIRIDAMVKAEDYHQKYYLKHALRLMKAILAFYPDEGDWDDSTLAARLNGFAGGYGDAALFDDEAAAMQLPSDLAADLREGLERRAEQEAVIGTCQRPTADS